MENHHAFNGKAHSKWDILQHWGNVGECWITLWQTFAKLYGKSQVLIHDFYGHFE